MNFLKPKFWNSKNNIITIFLLPISLLFGFLITVKKYFIKKLKFKIPIICVGNIYLGGTGKTPLCIEIFSILKNLNINPVFIRKKYSSFQDEFKMLKKTGTIYENKKRAEAIREAIKNKADVVVLDDGFQDLSINKNLSIVCFNEKQWIGNGLIIPAGPLRESLSGLQRANCVIINGNKNKNIENIILKNNKRIKIFYSEYMPTNLDLIKNQEVIAFAGIGNPENFFDLLIDNNIRVVEKISFPDHYNYKDEELEKLINRAQKKNNVLLTTEKDYLRIKENKRKKINYVKIETRLKDREEFINEIKKII